MAARHRTRLTAEQRAELWRRWKAGESVKEIAAALQRWPNFIYNVVRSCGGIAPRTRCRSTRVLSMKEREEISRGLMAGCSLRAIARHLKRAPSSISREVRRHGGPEHYRAMRADWRAWKRARRPKQCLFACNERLRQAVAHKLQIDWSPQQISAWLEIAYPDDETMRVSHETIYRSLFIQARGALKRELVKHLRRGHTIRGARKRGAGPMADAIFIRERPAQVEDRAVPGHWEGDLLCGDPHSQIATLVERHSRFVMLVKTPSKESTLVVRALAKQMLKLPVQLRRSLTWDRGFELKRHRDFTIATDMQVYICDPSSPWQRGSNENTNGLLRQYFPKGADLSGYSQQQLNETPCDSTNDHGRPWAFKLPRLSSRKPLHRPVEVTYE
jgi:IS30 family transposase